MDLIYWQLTEFWPEFLPGDSTERAITCDGIENFGDTEDVISRLPDELLTNILSFLPVKTMITTSVLSRRWNFLWTNVPSLDLNLSDFLARGNDLTSHTRRKANLFAFVERFLRQNRPCNIDLFELNCSDFKIPKEISNVKLYWSKLEHRDYENYPLYPGEVFRHCHSDLESWILLGERFKAQSLIIFHDMNMLQSRELRPKLVMFESLVVLKLWGYMFFHIPVTSVFPNLKVLILEDIVVNDDYSVSNLINSCCPVLDKLSVCSSGDKNDFNRITVTAKSLMRLHLESVRFGVNSTILGTGIDVPALQYLVLRNVIIITDNHSVGGLGALYEANLDVFSEDENGLYWLLKMICNVKKLTYVGIYIEGDDDIVSWKTLVGVLKKSPILQDLRVMGISFDRTKMFDWTSDHNIPRCLTTCLKTIEINPIHGNKTELKIMGYFLKHFQVLQKMIILVEKKGHKKRKTKKEILALPKVSLECDIIFK